MEVWRLGAYFKRMPDTGKLKLEGIEWVKGPSRTNTDPKCENKIKVKLKRGERNENTRKPENSKVGQKEYNTLMKAAVQEIKSRYYNSDSLFQLIGESNESKIVLECNKLPALIVSGAQVSAMTLKLARLMKLKIHKLQKLLGIEGTGGGKYCIEDM